MNWYYAVLNSPQQGPFSEEDMCRMITEKAIDGTTLVWNETLPEWQKLSCSTLATRLIPPSLPHVVVTPVDQFVVQNLPQQEQSVAPVFPPLPEKSAGESVEWYYSDGIQQHGPVSESEIARLIQEGRITSKSSLWNSSMADWVPVSNTGLSSVAPSRAATLPFTDAEYFELANNERLMRISTWCFYFVILISLVTFGLLTFSDIIQTVIAILFAAIAIVCVLIVCICSYKIASALKLKFAWVYFLFPTRGIHKKTRAALKLRGIEVGFMGVSSAEIASLQRN